MRYIIYKNITENDFVELKRKLESIERISSPIMQMNGFYLNRRSYEESLDLDYVHEEASFMGNIGVTYDEEESTEEKKLFRFYVLKAYDTATHRFYKKDGLNELYSIEEVEKSFLSLFEKCISIYNSLRKSELTESVKFK